MIYDFEFVICHRIHIYIYRTYLQGKNIWYHIACSNDVCLIILILKCNSCSGDKMAVEKKQCGINLFAICQYRHVKCRFLIYSVWFSARTSLTKISDMIPGDHIFQVNISPGDYLMSQGQQLISNWMLNRNKTRHMVPFEQRCVELTLSYDIMTRVLQQQACVYQLRNYLYLAVWERHQAVLEIHYLKCERI